MKALHFVNACAWFCNSIVWGLYAHVPLMAVASLGAAGVAILMMRGEQ